MSLMNFSILFGVALKCDVVFSVPRTDMLDLLYVDTELA